MSFVCYETDDHWEIGWESGIKLAGVADLIHRNEGGTPLDKTVAWMGVATADSQQKAFEICNYLNGGMPSVGMDLLDKLTNRLSFNNKK